jgi:1-acyl-sn-glycerol-3-phosphate acyltransferase
VPIAIRGTRHALPPGTMLPLPGRLDVELAPVIDPPTPGDAGSLEAVMNTARREILARIPEPDLAPGG